MYANRLACRSCGSQFPLELQYACPHCGGILEVKYDYDALAQDGRLTLPELPGLWKYLPLLPLQQEENIVSLGEGGTPLLRCQRMADIYGAQIEWYIKAEHLNPSGSFKDRPSSVGVSAAKEAGAEKVVIASSGNAAAATAAYSARAGMECVVFVPESTDPGKVIQAASYGATVIPVTGNYSHSYDMADLCAKRFGWPNITSTFLNPYTVEADKTVAYEIFEQLGGRFPDVVIIPIASGPLMIGAYKGFYELRHLGRVPAQQPLPAMVGVQSEQCMPITRAYLNGDAQVHCWDGTISTIAGGISDPLVGYENDGTLTLQTARASGGMMLCLTEGEIWQATQMVETKVGYYCEPTSATAIGAVSKLWNEGFLKKGATVVSVLTGHGFKYTGRRCNILQPISKVEQLEILLKKTQ